MMGCSHASNVVVAKNDIDSRIPFTRTQIEEIQDFWEMVKRKFEDTAKENMIRLFRLHPYFQCLFPTLKDLKTELDMRDSPAFETHALMVFAVFDDVIDNLDGDVQTMLEKLESVARIHAKADGFSFEFFQYMEEPFLEAFREKFWEKFTPHMEDLFKQVFKFVEEVLALEVEAIEYRLIPGD